MASETFAPQPVASPRRVAGSATVETPIIRPREGGASRFDPGQGERAPLRAGRALDGPRLRQLMGVCGWATVLGGVGLVLGIRGLIGIVTRSAPGWYEPAMSLTGMAGIALTVAGFLTVHRRRAPWILLGAASAVLIIAMVLTGKAF